jgi:LmbE family N-acetylglucosaminyl deacetylase
MAGSDLEEFSTVPGRALAIYAHPDDMEMACGATLATWAVAGATVHGLVVARGDKGDAEHKGRAEPRAGTREREAQRAAELLGLADVEFLGIPDGEVENQATLRERLVEAVRRLRPEIVLTHDPTAVFFGNRYYNHRDHRELGWAVLDAVFPASSLPGYFPHVGSPHSVGVALLSGSLEPNCYVQVAAGIDRKVQALLAYESRGVKEAEIRELVLARGAAEGARVGCAFAETFRAIVTG